jgi:hypothetical protein
MSDRVIGGVPLSGVKLSAAVTKKVKAYEEAKAKYVKYTSANRDCAVPKPYAPWSEQNNKPPALVKAEAELRKLDEKAAAEGKPLVDQEEYLKPVLARIEEYRRTEPALKKAMEAADAAARAAVGDELPALARQVFDRATEAKKAYEDALEKLQDAEAQFIGQMNRFIQYVTGGVVQRGRYHGLVQNEAEKYLSAWDLSENGRLSWEGAWSLGLVGAGAYNVDMIDLTDFVEPKEEVRTPWNHGHRSLDPDAERTTVWRAGQFHSE